MLILIGVIILLLLLLISAPIVGGGGCSVGELIDIYNDYNQEIKRGHKSETLMYETIKCYARPELRLEYDKEYTFKSGSADIIVSFDTYIVDENKNAYAFEYNGPQHYYAPVKRYNTFSEWMGLKENQNEDLLKKIKGNQQLLAEYRKFEKNNKEYDQWIKGRVNDRYKQKLATDGKIKLAIIPYTISQNNPKAIIDYTLSRMRDFGLLDKENTIQFKYMELAVPPKVEDYYNIATAKVTIKKTAAGTVKTISIPKLKEQKWIPKHSNVFETI
jgi:hypothetical protein